MDNLFEYYIETDQLHFKYAKGEPAVKSQEFHDYNEFVFFLEGNSFLISKHIQQELTTGSMILIPKEQFHQFCVSQPESYVRCILAFRETPELAGLTREVMNTVKIISTPDARIRFVFDHLTEIIKSDLSHEEKALYLHSALIQLLIFLKTKPVTAVCRNTTLSPVVTGALSIIDEKYAEALSVEQLAGLLYVSPSTLAHKFSKELNISVYRYITKKRLSAAHALIQQGESLLNAAAGCGFRDYSCFYRLYQKYYEPVSVRKKR